MERKKDTIDWEHKLTAEKISVFSKMEKAFPEQFDDVFNMWIEYLFANPAHNGIVEKIFLMIYEDSVVRLLKSAGKWNNGVDIEMYSHF